ncbi:SAM-dependent methyltransferase [Candidatus Thiodubiliella endoseptemdiera]|uniref:SAM-dependent methyltransferase n=1 Tax=Candidatus Thiodubiliella endoseptemdiera TaxID=2738886 RepID=UPI0034DE30A0
MIKKQLGQYYTSDKIAKELAFKMSNRYNDKDVLFIEPSAGTGSFVTPLLQLNKEVRAIDVEPKHDKVIRGDFLKDSHRIFDGNYSKKIVIGNPPFGKNSSLAVKFFNVSAEYADEIAFIVPRTFRKISVQNRLNRNFHITEDVTLPDNAFIFDGKSYDVPCAWQIWTRDNKIRPLIKAPKIEHIMDFLPSAENADFAIRRVGYYAGRVIFKDIQKLSKTTHYFIKEKTKGIRKILAEIDWVDITSQTAGVRSLSKTELAFKIVRML